MPQSEIRDVVYELLKDFYDSYRHKNGHNSGGWNSENYTVFISNEEKYRDVLYLISAGHTDCVEPYIQCCKELEQCYRHDDVKRKLYGFQCIIPSQGGSHIDEHGIDDILCRRHKDFAWTTQKSSKSVFGNINYGTDDAFKKGKENFAKYLKEVKDFADIAELRKKYPVFDDLIGEKYRKIVISHIKDGTLPAFKAKYPEELDKINAIALEFGINEDGEYVSKPKLPTPVAIMDYKQEAKGIDDAVAEKQKQAEQDAQRETELEKGTGAKRVLKGIFTLGISELIRSEYLEEQKETRLTDANKEIATQRQQLNNEYQSQIQQRQTQMESVEDSIKVLQAIEDKKEQAKQELQEGLIDEINKFYLNRPTDLPNCVMLVTPNPFIAHELAFWAGESTDTNFTYIPYNPDKDSLQEDLINELNTAEEEYQKTGKRSIIYAENMEDLINPDKVSAPEIAMMKDYMQCIDEDYHSTVIFQTTNPDKLWHEAIQENRVGLMVEIPITPEEADIYNNLIESEVK